MNSEAQALIKALRDKPVKFARLVGFDKLTDLHNDWIRAMLLEKEDFTLLGHRGSYKTTCLSFAFALLIVLRPDKTIFFIRKTDADVIEIVTQTKKILQHALFQYIVQVIYGCQLQLVISTAFKITTNLADSTRGQVQLQGMGLNGSLTGKHADYVFTDDIVNIKDRVSRAERQQTIRQYMELQNVKNRDGRIFNTGTPWHKDDCISTQMPNIHRYPIDDTGLIDDDQKQVLKESMTPSLYAANYELRHLADEDVLFKSPQWAKPEDIELLKGGQSQIDASYGGSDWTAYTIMHELPDGRIIAFGKLWQQHVDKCLPYIKSYQDEHMVGTIHCETNGDKGYLSDELENDYNLIVHPYHERMNKHLKISTYLLKYWKDIYWLPDTDAEYMDMVLEYNEHAEHDDAPDSAASLVREMIDEPVVNKSAFLLGGW